MASRRCSTRLSSTTNISSIDVLYDLAFLLMDLGRLGLPHHANVALERLPGRDRRSGRPAIDAAVPVVPRRSVAKTTATSANLQTDAGPAFGVAGARERLPHAWRKRCSNPPPPRLIAIGGLSGSGKSTLAVALAPSVGATPGAVVIRSDEIRKKLCGVQPLERLGPEGYTDEMSRRVYATLMDQAEKVVCGGYTAIVDAVFAESADRDAIATRGQGQRACRLPGCGSRRRSQS